MENLIKKVAERAGISEEQARTATQTVVGFLKERLPAPIASQVESALGGGAEGAAGGLADKASGAIGGLGSMFGGKKE